jgi:enoyl-CoA hydratase
MLHGQREEAFGFFAVEYEMNRLIAKYDKPIVALTHGVVMGGGLGIAGHARYRIATSDARFAMPEAAIGFFCDVGIRSILARAARHRALIFMLSGNLIGLGDAIALGLSDVGVEKTDFAKVRAEIIAAGAIDDVEGEIKNVISRFRIEPGDADICQLADRAEAVFQGKDYATIIAELKAQGEVGAGLTKIAHTIVSRCPTSNFVHVAGLDAARQNGDIDQVLDADLRLAHFMAQRDDFAEGVRAVLIDKDHTPKWVPARIENVEVDLIREILLQE